MLVHACPAAATMKILQNLSKCVSFLHSGESKSLDLLYCRFGNFRENFNFANIIKRYISDVKNSRLRQDLPISINDRVILPFREGLFS